MMLCARHVSDLHSDRLFPKFRRDTSWGFDSSVLSPGLHSAAEFLVAVVWASALISSTEVVAIAIELDARTITTWPRMINALAISSHVVRKFLLRYLVFVIGTNRIMSKRNTSDFEGFTSRPFDVFEKDCYERAQGEKHFEIVLSNENRRYDKKYMIGPICASTFLKIHCQAEPGDNYRHGLLKLINV